MSTKSKDKDLVGRFERLIAGHAELHAKEMSRTKTAIEGILPGFLAARKQWAEAQKQSADDFNLFEVLAVEGDEVRHSKILAWLLDHRIERGTHAQGNLGLKLFLQELDKELQEDHVGKVAAYANEENYWVHAELSGDESRVDIEIGARGKFLIHLENKIHAAE